MAVVAVVIDRDVSGRMHSRLSIRTMRMVLYDWSGDDKLLAFEVCFLLCWLCQLTCMVASVRQRVQIQLTRRVSYRERAGRPAAGTAVHRSVRCSPAT